MSNIVEELREMSGDMIGPYICTANDAADEIKRLKEQNTRLLSLIKRARNRWICPLCARKRHSPRTLEQKPKAT